MAAQGFRCHVLNSSGEVEADRRMLLAVRESVGDGQELRLDGLAQYDMESARDLCTE